MMKRLRTIAMLPVVATLAAYNGPTQRELAKAVGDRDITDVSCAQATGTPGYVCTFRLGRDVLAWRVVKSEAGGWQAAY